MVDLECHLFQFSRSHLITSLGSLVYISHNYRSEMERLGLRNMVEQSGVAGMVIARLDRASRSQVGSVCHTGRSPQRVSGVLAVCVLRQRALLGCGDGTVAAPLRGAMAVAGV